jgi:L-lactate dehydrogenase complex protein LldG
MERSAFLARVATATETAALPDVPPTDVRLPRLSSRHVRFVTEAEAVGCVVHEVDRADSARQLLLDIADQHGVSTFTAWDSQHLGVRGVAPFLSLAGLEPVTLPPGDDPVDWRASNTEVARAGLGITGALGGLAYSGSVLLQHGPGRPRTTSLLPEVHVALLDRSKLFSSLLSFSRRNRRVLEGSSNLVVVTGPSRTGDIEMVLTKGVHGPKHVHVVLLDF